MASEIRVDKLKNTLGIGTITLSPTGQELLGITTTSVLKVTDGTNSTSSTTGALIVTGGVGIAASLNVGGSVSIGGTLTYEDVTNIDSVGIITGRTEIRVGSGITLSKDGDIFATGVTTTGSLISNAGLIHIISATEPALRLQDTNNANSDFKIYSPDGDNSLRIYHQNTSKDLVSLTSSGKLGIGTEVVSQELVAKSTTFASIALKSDRSTGTDQIGGFSFYNHAGVSTATINGLVNGTLLFKTTGTERARIDTSGSFQIATTSGNEKLNVAGAIRSSGSSADFNAGLEGALVDYDTSNNIARFGHVNGASGSGRSVVFLTGGSEKMRITAAGALNIGAATPTASENGQFNCYTTTASGKAQFVHASGTGGLRLAGTGAGSGANLVFSNDYNGGTFSDHWTLTHNGGDDSFRFLIGGTGGNEAFRIKSDGSVGILQGGATATSGAGEVTWPYSPLHVKYYSNTSASTSGTYGQYIENYVGSDLSQQKTWIGMAFHDDNPNNRPQVKFGAEVGQRADANTQPKEGSGNFVVYTATGNSNYDDNATEKFVVKYDGTATISGSNVTSDIRLKTDITTLTGSLDKVKQLRGVEYLWNDVAIDNRGMINRGDGEKQIGVIADEVQSIYPALVDDNGLQGRDGTYYKQVAYERLVPILLEAIKELSAKVESLEST